MRARKRRSSETIDLNADLGEGPGKTRLTRDAALLDLISSANIACGFHAGDATSMRETVLAARERGVAIGAHPSYPDVHGFGRRELDLEPAEIARHVSTQVSALRDVAVAAGARVSHVKPHGALYSRAAIDAQVARAVADAIAGIDPRLILLGLAESEMTHAAERAGIRFAAEAFADRAYTRDLTLVPRERLNAVIDDPRAAARVALDLVQRRIMRTSDGSDVPLDADSLCVHGDNPAALEILRAVRSALETAGVRIASFAS